MLKISQYTLKNQQLSGVKLVFATDFHIAPYCWEKWRLKKIVAAISHQKADIVLLGGDYVNRHSKNTTLLPQEIASYLQQIETPKFAVLGNHDSYYNKEEVKQALSDKQIIVLDNQIITVENYNHLFFNATSQLNAKSARKRCICFAKKDAFFVEL